MDDWPEPALDADTEWSTRYVAKREAFMSTIHVRRGLDLPIAGAAEGCVVTLPVPDRVAWVPTSLGTPGQGWRVLVNPGDAVVAGQPLFESKAVPGLCYPAPLAGTVAEVRRGERRVLEAVVVTPDGSDAHAPWPAYAAADIGGLARADVVAALLRSGLWGTLRTRPLDLVPSLDADIQSILVCGTETGPLQAPVEVLLDGVTPETLQAGLDALGTLGAPVHLTRAADAPAVLVGRAGVTEHVVVGPHPSGDPAVQVNLIDPPQGARRVVYLRAHEVAAIGAMLLTGRYPASRVFAVVGLGTRTRRFVRSVVGAPVVHLVGDLEDGVRLIAGSVLTGRTVALTDFAGDRVTTFHALPGEVERHVLGWTMPMLGAFSAHRAFLTGLFGAGGRRFDLRPGVYGGIRAIIPVNALERVIATPDILPEPLFRSVAAEDIEEAVALGLLDLSPEEAALMTYVCPSKVDYDVLLAKGLAQYMREN